MINHILPPTSSLRSPIDIETKTALSDSGNLLSSERNLQRTTNVLNAVGLPISIEKNKITSPENSNNFSSLNHKLSQIRLANNNCTDMVLSDEEYPLKSDVDIKRELIVPLESDLFFQILEQVLEVIEESPIPQRNSLRSYLHHMLTVSNIAVTKIYSQANEFEKQLLQPLVDSSPTLVTLLSKEGKILSQTSEAEKNAYSMWYHLMIQLTSNAPLYAIDTDFLYPEPNIQGSLYGTIEANELKDALDKLPYLNKASLTLDDLAAKELLNCEVPKFLRKLTLMYANDQKSISGEQVAHALQKFAFTSEIRSLSLIPLSNNIRETLNIPPLELFHLEQLTQQNEKLKQLELFIPITDPKVIKRLHQLFPQVEAINFNLRATAPEDYAEMRAALKLFPKLTDRVLFLNQLCPKIPDNHEEFSVIDKIEIKRHQQEIIEDLIHACLPDLSITERSALISRWKEMLDNQSSEIDFSAFVTLLFSRDASTTFIVGNSEYRDPVYGIKLRQALSVVLQALPDDPELAAMCAAYAHEAISTCHDKAILGFRDCVKAVTVATLLKEPVMLSRHQLITLGSSLFQEEQLKDIVSLILATYRIKVLIQMRSKRHLVLLASWLNRGKLIWLHHFIGCDMELLFKSLTSKRWLLKTLF